MKPDKFAEFLHAHARLLHRAGANPVADAISQVAAYFAEAKGATVKTALKGAKPAGQRNPAAAPLADLIAYLQASAATISAKAPAIADLSLLREALTGPGTTLAEVVAGWSAPVAKPVRKTPTTRKAAPKTSGLREDLVAAYAAEIQAATLEAAFAAFERLESDKKMRVTELRALAERLGGTAPPKSAKKPDLLRQIRLPIDVSAATAAKEKAIRAKGTL